MLMCASKFKELNSTLNREVTEFERAQAAGTRHLGDGGSEHAYSALEAEAQAYTFSGTHVLGGSGSGSANDSPEERRRRVLEATMNRLRKEEEELEERCGTAGQ